MPTRFSELDWRTIAWVMGATIQRIDPREVRMHVRGLDLIIADNGGELNVMQIVPLEPAGKQSGMDYDYSVPYETSARPSPGPWTLADWLLHRIDGERPDYSADLDADAPTADELRAQKGPGWQMPGAR